MQPDWEAPWLVLAAVSHRRAGMAYLEKALEINPESRHARTGLAWMQAHPAGSLGMSSRRIGQGRAAAVSPPPIPIDDPVANEEIPSTSPKNPRLFRHPLVWLISILALLVILMAIFSSRLNLPFLLASGPQVLLPVNFPSPTIASVETLPADFAPTAAQSGSQSKLQAPSLIEVSQSVPTPTSTSEYDQLPTITPSMLEGLLSGEYADDSVPAQGEKRIVINLGEQRLYAYQGDTLVFRFVVSTGANDGTRTGTFSILDKIPRAYGADWNFWMPDWMGIYFAGSYEDGIHTLPLLPDGERIWGNTLGTPVTYGCVVLGIRESRLLYDWSEVGTTVQINP